MGSAFYRIKIGLYIFIIIIVGVLFSIRVHNAWQRINYSTKTVLKNGDIQISLHYPTKILSAKSDASYPLILSFYYTGDKTSPHTYEISLQSSTLLFVDAKGGEIPPYFQFTSNKSFLEQSVYVHPYLSDAYQHSHLIHSQVFVDGQAEPNQQAPIEIETEKEWVSFFSLAAASLLEISIASALVTWTVNALDTALTSRKERVTEKKDKLNNLITLPYLERLEKFISLEAEIKKGNLTKDLRDELQHWQRFFSSSENEFMQTVGILLRRDDQTVNFENIHKFYVRFFTAHKGSIDTLAIILSSKAFVQEEILSHIVAIVKLWDDLETNAKDFIIGALKGLSQKINLPAVSEEELNNLVFDTVKRRRLLRDAEIQMIFPQLVDPLKGKPLPLGYDAKWRHLPSYFKDPSIIDWLRDFSLISNPFGASDLMNYPIYPEGLARPDRWEDILAPLPQRVQCLTLEDAKALTNLMRSECLPRQTVDVEGKETLDSGKQIFPLIVSFEKNAPFETPLITLIRSTAIAWMEILPFSPDAMLDLLPTEQVALLELLCWNFGSSSAVVQLFKRIGQKDSLTDRLLIRKIDGFNSEFSSSHIPQDTVLLSWLKLRPPDITHTYLIIPLDEFPISIRSWWLEQFIPLISTLFLSGIVTKAFSSSDKPVGLPLSIIRLNWSEIRLKASLNAQFEAAMYKDKRDQIGERVDFRSLFGSNASVGYFETENDTTDKLISASHNSLARMLKLGNYLLEKHCEQEVPKKYLSVAELEAILKVT